MKEKVMVKKVLGLLVVAVVVGLVASFLGFEDVAAGAWLFAVLAFGFLIGVDVERSEPVRERRLGDDR